MVQKKLLHPLPAHPTPQPPQRRVHLHHPTQKTLPVPHQTGTPRPRLHRKRIEQRTHPLAKPTRKISQSQPVWSQTARRSPQGREDHSREEQPVIRELLRCTQTDQNAEIVCAIEAEADAEQINGGEKESRQLPQLAACLSEMVHDLEVVGPGSAHWCQN